MQKTDFFTQVRDRFPLSRLVSERVKLRKIGKEFSGPCPFHAEKTPSFRVNDEKGLYYCFGCGAKGDAFNFVMESQKVDLPEAMKILSEKTGIPIPSLPGDPARDHTRYYDILAQATSWFQEQLQLGTHQYALDYCTQRGLEPSFIKEFQLGYAPESLKGFQAQLEKKGFSQKDLLEVGLLGEDQGRFYERFRRRLMIPIHDKRGRVVGFGGRLLQGEGPKYLNSPETPVFKKGEMLFGLPFVGEPLKKKQPLLVVEGYMDAITLLTHGYAAVAPLGTALSAAQLELAWQYAAEPVICFDGDGAGRKASQRVVDVALPCLRPGFSVNFAFLPEGEDPDSFVRAAGRQAFDQVLSTVRPLIDFIWQLEWDAVPLQTPEQKANLQVRLREQVQTIGHQDIRRFYEQAFYERLQEAFRRPSPSYTKAAPKAAQESHRQPKGRLSSSVFLLQQRILLAMVLRHPELLEADLERFSDVSFTSDALKMLKNAIIDYVNLRVPLDREALVHHLKGGGHGETVDYVLRAEMHMRSINKDAAALWNEVLNGMTRTTLTAEVDSVHKGLHTHMNQEQWQKLKTVVALYGQTREDDQE